MPHHSKMSALLYFAASSEIYDERENISGSCIGLFNETKLVYSLQLLVVILEIVQREHIVLCSLHQNDSVLCRNGIQWQDAWENE